MSLCVPSAKADDIDVKDYMIKNNYAKPYNGGTKDSW